MKLKPIIITAAVAMQGIVLTSTLYFLNQSKEIQEEFYDEENDSADQLAVSEIKSSSKVPFQNFVTASGKVSCSSYVKINVKKEGIIEDIYVKEGDTITKGDVLLTLEQGMLPFVLREKIADYDTAVAEFKLIDCQTDPDQKNEQKDVMKANIRKKEANMEALEKSLKDCTITSPVDGKVLKTNTNPGEFINPKDEALVIGVDSPLYLKVLVAEKEMWRIQPSKNLRAIAYHKTNPLIHFVLDFVTVKPQAIENEIKESFVEVVFAFEKGKAPIYLDQSLDVCIEALNSKDAAFFEYQFNKN